MKSNFLLLIGALLIYTACDAPTKPAVVEPTGPKIVFVTGDEEYRSEESMPMLAEILKRELDAQVTVCYALDSLGFINPNVTNHIAGLEALESADLMVMFTRFRNLPNEELEHILHFAESGKPMVGFRTSTHSFLYKEDSTKIYLNEEWPAKVFGQQWITHHGHFEDGDQPLTQVDVIGTAKDHPILRGFNEFQAYSWLYHVEGGEWHVKGRPDFLLFGTSLRSKHEEDGNLGKYPLTNPVAWTKNYGQSRVFFTTLGHPFDFLDENMRRLSLNGIYWALGMEDKIPMEGVNATLASEYAPNNSGFGEKFKKGITPKTL
jgi:uncharacterized protein